MPSFHSLSSNRALLIAKQESKTAGIAMWRRSRRGPLLTMQTGCAIRKRVTRQRYLGGGSGGEWKERGGMCSQCQLSSANCERGQ